MKIGILEAGLIRDELADRFDPYPVMFERLLNRAGRELEYAAFSPVRGQMPASIDDCDGWLITGSRHGVYDELEWMAPLQDFIRELAEARRPLIGVCFGHQIIADAMGGEVVKSNFGWKVGLQRYRVDKYYPWMDEPCSSVAIHAWHQDQVVEKPAEAEIISSTDFCKYAGLAYGDTIWTFQPHPEYDNDFLSGLIEKRGKGVVPEPLMAAAREKLAAPTDRMAVGQIMADFFKKERA